MRLLSVSIVVALACPSVTFGRVVERDWLTEGDGLLILDTESGFEWLDLTQTLVTDLAGPDGTQTPLQRAEDALAELMITGGILADFEFASSDEVFALARSAGIDTSTRSPASNAESAVELKSLLGNVTGLIGNGSVTGWVLGESSPEYPSPIRVSIYAYPGGRDRAEAGITFTSGLLYAAAREGVWLRRTPIVPEPGSLSALSIVAFCCLAAIRPRARSPIHR